MKKFLVLYRMDMAQMHEMMAQMSKEEQEKDMADWRAWIEQNMSSFADAGDPVGKNTQVSPSGTTETPNDVGGYAIMQGETKEEVLALLAQSPHLKMPGTTTDVMEIVSM